MARDLPTAYSRFTGPFMGPKWRTIDLGHTRGMRVEYLGPASGIPEAWMAHPWGMRGTYLGAGARVGTAGASAGGSGEMEAASLVAEGLHTKEREGPVHNESQGSPQGSGREAKPSRHWRRKQTALVRFVLPILGFGLREPQSKSRKGD